MHLLVNHFFIEIFPPSLPPNLFTKIKTSSCMCILLIHSLPGPNKKVVAHKSERGGS